MTGHYDYLHHIRHAIEQRLGRSLSQVEFEILLIRGHGQFWELDWRTGGIRLRDLADIELERERS